LKLLPAAQDSLGERSRVVGNLLALVADIDLRQNRLDDAERSINKRLEAEGPNSELMYFSKMNLGVIEVRRKNYMRAEALLREAIAGARESSNLPLEGMCQDNLAGTFFEQGRWPEAEQAAEGAFRAFRESLGWEPSTEKCFGNLFMLYHRVQKWDKLEA